ncbi:MAG: dihydroorotate dehydrogenase electron transfer subunit [Planctomycetaceae bacterium]|nr:dihydroorotate dehydrogenase electron transfer subunit [Planctomycetaceae bacterium]MCL2305776.1 dihydroorotate dehydrogenase electron transfer subunit [Planctomycetaceae bacterium]
MPHPFCSTRAVISDHVFITENICVAQNTWRLRLSAEKIVPLVKPGQFVMLRLPNRSDPLLGRPLAVYRTTPDGFLEVVYLVVGKMTARLAQLKAGDPLEIWGPLGNGFEAAGYDRIIMVAGGIGQTPFLMLAEQFVKQHGPQIATLLFGARTRDRICCVDDFRNVGTKVVLATDDGSEGYHGPVTDLIPTVVSDTNNTKVLCCGPQPMLHSAFVECQKLGLPCDVSLESPMACGLGICYSCVVEYQQDDSNYEYVRTCYDGPVFDAYKLKIKNEK